MKLLFHIKEGIISYQKKFPKGKDSSGDDNMEEEISLNCDDTLNYVKNNVNTYDTIEISFNRIYLPGEVLDIDIEEKDKIESLNLMMQLNGELVNDTIQLDLVKIKDDILEIRHIQDEKSIVITVEA